MFAAIKWNSRYNAREWGMKVGVFAVQLRALNANRQKDESKPRRPPWKHFDDTHHLTPPRRNGSPTMIGDQASGSLSLMNLSSGAVTYKQLDRDVRRDFQNE